MERALRIAAVVLAVLTGGGTLVWGAYRWAQDAIAQAVQAEVSGLEDNVDRLLCTGYYGKPRAVCECEFFEAAQRRPNPERCEQIERLVDQGREKEAEALAVPEDTP